MASAVSKKCGLTFLLKGARNRPVFSIITGNPSTLDGILSRRFFGFTEVKILMQLLPLCSPIATPSTPTMLIHSSVLSLRTSSMLLSVIGPPLPTFSICLSMQPLRLPAMTIAPIIIAARNIYSLMTRQRNNIARLFSNAPHAS